MFLSIGTARNLIIFSRPNTYVYYGNTCNFWRKQGYSLEQIHWQTFSKAKGTAKNIALDKTHLTKKYEYFLKKIWILIRTDSQANI